MAHIDGVRIMQELNFIVTNIGKQKLGEATLDNPVQLAGVRLFEGYIAQELAEIEVMEDIITDASEDQEIILSPLGGNYDFTAGIMSLEASDNGTDAYQAKTAVIYYEENTNKIPFAITTSQQVAFTKLATSALTVSAHLTFQEESEVYIDFAYEISHPLANTDNAGIVRLATVDDVEAGITTKDNTPLVMQAGQGCSLLSRNGNPSPIFSITEGQNNETTDINALGNISIFGGLKVLGFISFKIFYESCAEGEIILNNGVKPSSSSAVFTNLSVWGVAAKGTWKLATKSSSVAELKHSYPYDGNSWIAISGTVHAVKTNQSIAGTTSIVYSNFSSTEAMTINTSMNLYRTDPNITLDRAAFYCLFLGV